MSKNLLEDIKKAGVQLLDDDELEQVNGGKEYDDWCWMDYCCFLVLKHPDDAKPGDSCTSNYVCLFGPENSGEIVN